MKKQKSIYPLILVLCLFFAWGLAHNMTDTLLAAFKKILILSDFETSWVQMAFYGAYFCFALPAAFYIKRFSYKSGILFGLGLYITGALLFYPASQALSYTSFLVALYVLAAGLAILETAANPYILGLGSPETATQRLNWAQSFNPIGSLTGVFLSKLLILSNLSSLSLEERVNLNAVEMEQLQQQELNAMIIPYLGVAGVLLFLWLLIYKAKMPSIKAQSEVKEKIQSNKWQSFRTLLRSKSYTGGLVAQFFYIGAQIGVWSYTIRYVMSVTGTNEADASNYYLYSLIVFALGRFIFSAAMKYINAKLMLTVLALTGVLLCGIVIFIGGMAGVYALILISVCMSIMFPTIYSLAMEHVTENRELAGAGIIMMILGGAVLTAIQGYISDLTNNIHYSFIIPMGCFLVISLYSSAKFYVYKTQKFASIPLS